MNRAQRRARRGHGAPAPDPLAQAIAKLIDAGPAARPPEPAEPLVATVPAATDGTDDSRAAARTRSHDAVLDLVASQGATPVGPVSWYEWGPDPDDVAAALAYLSDAGTDSTYAEFPAWFAAHPGGTLILAAVPAVPTSTST